jgi:site-specific DNA recombinase
MVLNEEFFDGLYERVVHIEDNLQYRLMENSNDLFKYRQLLAIKEKELKKHHQALDKLYEMREEQVLMLNQEIEDLKLIIQEQSDIPSMDKLKQNIKVFKEKWRHSESAQERNKLLKRIVDKITYNREANNVYLGIQYN